METLGGVLLSGHEPAGADDDGFFQRTMARFNEEAKGHGAVAAHSLWRPRQSTKLDPGDAIMMPAPLAGLTGLRRDSVVWKPAMQGVSSLAIPAFPEKEGLLHLLKMEPGSVLPDEFHDGSHLILVLWGAYESEQGRFERGDLADIEPETTHRFHANHPEGATCVVATDAHAGHLHAWAL
jgi:putative transcriptional regulator